MKSKLHKFKIIKLTFFTALLVGSTLSMYAQLTTTWTGDTNTDFYNALNWTNESLDYTGDIQAYTFIIGAGSPNDPIQIGGANNGSKRPAYLNTETGCNLTFNGVLYAGDTQYWRGTITVNDGADISVRNTMLLGKEGAGTLNITGGKFWVKNYSIIGDLNGIGEVNLSGGIFLTTDLDMEIASDARNAISGTLNITGGMASVKRNLIIGSNGIMNITSPGTFSITGDQRTAMNNYISAGKIVATNGSLQVVYDGTNTIISIDPSTLSIKGDVLSKAYKIYPNPTSGEFSINLPKGMKNVSTKLYNINGLLISSKEQNVISDQITLDISDKASGVYFLKINTEIPQTIKVIKQ